MSTYNLTQIVDVPTRIAKHSETLLDVFFIDISTYANVQIHPFINGLSDHDAQILCLTKFKSPFKQKKAPRTQSRLINDMTIKSFLSELKDELWDQVVDSFNTNETFNFFLDTLMKNFEAAFPLIYTTRRNRQHNWISKGIRISCKKKRDLYILCKNNRDNTQMARHYKKYCKILNKVIKESKKQYFHNLIASSSNRIKTAWRMIRDNSGTTPQFDRIDSLICGNMLLKNPKDIAHAFNNYYSNISVNLGIKRINRDNAILYLHNINLNTITQMEMTPISELEVINVLHSLKPKDSVGYDGISTRILKYCACAIRKPLTHILNCSLMSGTCPDRCKFAIVRPVHKKGKLDEINNYRPISLLPAISKILESLMYKRLLQHLESNKILTPAQYGFRTNFHINDAIFNLSNTITNLLDQ
jgi:potassium voltage-gated channel Eag-related subfamily H protein 8